MTAGIYVYYLSAGAGMAPLGVITIDTATIEGIYKTSYEGYWLIKSLPGKPRATELPLYTNSANIIRLFESMLD